VINASSTPATVAQTRDDDVDADDRANRLFDA